MANMHLVTGFAGREHVTAADHGSLHAALFGSGNFLLDKGGKFALTKISDNLIRIADGDLLMQGRHIRIEDGAYVELAVENGTQGYLRRDLVVARYTKDADSGVEECNVIILRGDPVGAAPADPAYITGDIINDGATTNDVPLYRLNLDGIEIASVDSLLPETIPMIPEILGEHAASIAALQAALAGSTSAKIQTGSYVPTGTNQISLTFEFKPKFVTIYPDPSTNSGSSGLKNWTVLCFALTDSFTATGIYEDDVSKNTKSSSNWYARVVGNTLDMEYRPASSGPSGDGSNCANYKYNAAYLWVTLG